MRVTAGKIGPLNIKIEGNGRLFSLFCNELIIDQDLLNNESITWDLVVYLSKGGTLNESFIPVISSAKTHFTFDEETFFSDSPRPYYCKNLFQKGTCILQIKPKNLRRLKKLKKALSAKFNSEAELSYSLFWFVINALLLKKNCSFIHAGVYSSDGEATALMGTGGSGKTSLLFQVLNDLGYQYLSEDFGILRDDGSIFLNSKTISIYNSDVSPSNEILSTYISKLTGVEKINWYLNTKLRKMNPMKKVPVNELFDVDNLPKKSKLKRSIYIVRENRKTPKVIEVGAQELSKRMMNVNMREMKRLIEILNLINANAHPNTSFIEVDEYMKKSINIYAKGFSASSNYLLKLPFKMKGEETMEFLKSSNLIG